MTSWRLIPLRIPDRSGHWYLVGFEKPDCVKIRNIDFHKYLQLARPEGLEPPTPWFVARYSAPTELRAHIKPDVLYSSLLLGTPAATKHCCLQATAFRYRFSTGAVLQRNPRPGLKNHWGTMFTFIFRCHTDAVVSIVVSGRATPRLHRLPCRCRYEFCSASLFSR